ncbi:hypothetical protein AMATHDRAFT_69528 [Amanita thiersii Skay4041]|uniref:P-loop containing nucleoside triphosphate hydrolase protein n=1 Tax=Amanita thiersii Skay4041 TaxID=703135 RepID=A0A2A9NEB4_9AGAR|nr:hypothetical protein AMATHDRAFT_69528 [Amanita thiersii Skay4041]
MPENLDGFDDIDVTLPDQYDTSQKLSTQEALKAFDDLWYALTYRRARWMDLLGDYAGNELFIVDGESLVQNILDDPLLALGKENDYGFQIIHAYFLLEKALLEFKRRSANFEIVFWEAYCHATIHTGASNFVVSSRHLARMMLYKHLLKLDVTVHVFNDFRDAPWKRYLALKKPMFIIGNDGGEAGGTDDLDDHTAARLLSRRLFVFHVLTRGIAFARLSGAEYREFKIITFVSEQSRNPNAHKLLPGPFWDAATEAKDELDSSLLLAGWSPTMLLKPGSKDVPLKTILKSIAKDATSSESSSITRVLTFTFLLHCAILPDLPVISRSRQIQKLDKRLMSLLLDSFLPSIFWLLAGLSAGLKDCIDLDGRTFVSILLFLIAQHKKGVQNLVPPSSYATVSSIWSELSYSRPNLFTLRETFLIQAENMPKRSTAKIHPLLPFNNEVFDKELAVIDVPVQHNESEQDPSAKYFNFGQGVEFSDDKHWHTQRSILPRHQGGGKPKKLGYFARQRALKRDQVFMLRLQNQAATLTGAAGAVLQQIIIAPAGTRNEARRRSNSHAVIEAKKKERKLSSVDKMRLQIKAEKAVVQENATLTWWRDHLKAMSSMPNQRKKTYLTALFKNKRAEEASIRLEMQLCQLNLEFLLWIDEYEHESVRDKYTVSVVRVIKDICDGGSLTPTAVKMVSSALHAIGLADYISMLTVKDGVADKSLSFKPLKLVSTRTKEPEFPYMRIQEDPILWQLRLFGEYMDRSMDGSPDSRVSFIPDAWQKKVLDNIDANHSLLVVAPTSAGKTFISFYAMEKVLRDSDDGILVYVAPTKALVTQVAAEVYGRFSKTSKDGQGSCWAIHTRDYRIHDPLNCQILITVPEVLAIMLLSPSIARKWTSRIKRIILDEIHCIGQQEGGAVWEQIILFAPSPIIGLSATIGSPEIFNNWLKTVQEAHGYKHTFIEHPHRYSHLRKFYHVLNKKNKARDFSGLADYKSTTNTRFLHPISMLSFGVQSIPPDLALEAQDTLSLYQALSKHQKLLECDIQSLEPRRFFAESNGRLLAQKDIIRYESALKDTISSVLKSFDPEDNSHVLHSILGQLTDRNLASAPDAALNNVPSIEVFLNNLIYLVADLHARDELPAILFSFDRAGCERMLKFLLETLERAEHKWRDTSPEWQRKVQAWKAWQIRAKSREKQLDRELKQKRQDEELEMLRQEQDSGWESRFDPDEPSEQFSFANTKAYSKADLEKDIAELATVVDPSVLIALKRGIAVHHSGMNKGYRALVESLFRQRFIRVLISTGTLALGINAPAKTTVFVGDSPYLTALMYRQCAGRAGRRGFDLLGNVIFYGLTMDRVQRLVLSKLPTLGGNFPLTSTLVLRLCNLLHGSDNAPIAVNAVRTVLSLPSISFGSEVGRHQLLHHLRFSLEYLRRNNLLDSEGKPMNLYAIVAHLYYTEPSNLALVALLQSGVLHKICSQESLISAKHDYIHLMCHLFGRRYIPQLMLNSETVSTLIKKSPSMVILPPLPKSIKNILRKHNSEVLNIFTSYVTAYTTEHIATLGDDNRLPLSGKMYAAGDDLTVDESPLDLHLKKTAIQSVARSTFVSNSGHGDTFDSVPELAQTVRDGVYLNEHAIPSMKHLLSKQDNEHQLNAYLLDFYNHGQTAALVAANGIRPNDMWYFLEDFSLTLSTMKAGLEQLFSRATKAFDEAAQSNETKSKVQHTNSEDSEVLPDEIQDDFELDSGYGTMENSWFDDEDGAEEATTSKQHSLAKPPGVTKKDWRVYEVVSEAHEEFMQKFKAMWA